MKLFQPLGENQLIEPIYDDERKERGTYDPATWSNRYGHKLRIVWYNKRRQRLHEVWKIKHQPKGQIYKAYTRGDAELMANLLSYTGATKERDGHVALWLAEECKGDKIHRRMKKQRW